MTAVQTAVLLPTKPSSDDDSEIMYSFGAEVSSPPIHRVSAVSHDATPHNFGDLSLIGKNAISMLMQLGPYLGSFFFI